MSTEDKNQLMLPVPYKKGVGLLYAALSTGIRDGVPWYRSIWRNSNLITS